MMYSAIWYFIQPLPGLRRRQRRAANHYRTITKGLCKRQAALRPTSQCGLRSNNSPTGRILMPTPLQILLDPISLTVLGLYGVLIVLEALFPARRLPSVKGWKTRALIVFVLYFYGSSYLPLLWDPALAKYQLFNLEALNPLVGA